jgi:hypothetical protein
MPVSLPPKYVTVIDHNYNMTNPWYTYFFDLTTAGGTYQPLDTDLTAISGLTGTGIAVRTGAGTWTTRTLTGTANKIDVTNGDGVSGNPTVTISATYVGQTSITTLGTITAGTWNGSVITTPYGGTGLASYTQGDLLYYDAGTVLSKLAKNTSATRYLSNQGTSNNPSWNQVNLANGVTGTLPAGNGGTGVTSLGNLTKGDDTNGTLTLGGTPTGALITSASITAGWAGQLAVTRGGTGLSTTTQGDILYADAANSLAKLAKNTSSTRVLTNTGTSNNPAWAQVDLTTGVTGTLPVANGGTGVTSSTGSTSVVLSNTPTLVTPVLGVASATSINFGQDPLNYYDEGTWTPIDASGAGLTFITPDAKYTRIGQFVSANGFVIYPATADANQAIIGGLPFTVGTGNATGSTVTYVNTANAGFIICNISTTTASVYSPAGAATTNAQMSSAVFFFSCMYTV